MWTLTFFLTCFINANGDYVCKRQQTAVPNWPTEASCRQAGIAARMQYKEAAAYECFERK